MQIEKLEDAEQRALLYSLRHPRGRYLSDRAAQLSGVPRSTLYDWRRENVYCPDFDVASPATWSYRDLVFLRLLAWLRQLGMPRPVAASGVAEVKILIAQGVGVRRIAADSRTLVLDDEGATKVGHQNLLPFDNLISLFRSFDLLEPIEELRRPGHSRLWAPDLVSPSEHTFISPWILAGDPCVQRTRIPTLAIHALRNERGLSSGEIVELYPGLTQSAAEDACRLEQRLRGFDLPSPAAA